MKFIKAKFVENFMRMANDGVELGWHERNGGNLSYRVKDEEVKQVKRFLKAKEWQSIGVAVPNLANEYFLVTGSGKFFRNIVLNPEDSFGMIEIDDKGENYRIVWGLVNGGKPTSELPSHLMNQEVQKIKTNGKNRVIYHAHPANLIALTFVLPLEETIFTRELWESMTECAYIFPQGVGVLKWMMPGSIEIAKASGELMKNHDVVVWGHHGIFVAGEDFDNTFGLLHAIEKASEVELKVLACGKEKAQTITPDDFRAFSKYYNLNLDEKFLFNK